MTVLKISLDQLNPDVFLHNVYVYEVNLGRFEIWSFI